MSDRVFLILNDAVAAIVEKAIVQRILVIEFAETNNPVIAAQLRQERATLLAVAGQLKAPT